MSERYRLIKAVLARPLCASRREAGVTAVEMAVVLVIIGLVMISIVPSVQDYMELARAKGALEQVVSAMRLARQYAVGTSATSYTATLTTTTIQFACETACPGTVPNEPTVTLVNGGTLPDGAATVRFGRQGTLLLDSTGAAATSATAVKVQYLSPGNVYYVSQVCISIVGRIVATAYNSQAGSAPTPPDCPA